MLGQEQAEAISTNEARHISSYWEDEDGTSPVYGSRCRPVSTGEQSVQVVHSEKDITITGPESSSEKTQRMED